MALSNKRIFITGGAGFIGSTLARKYADQNEVILFDNLSRDSATQSGLLNHSNVSLVEGDVLDRTAVAKAMTGANVVVHAAAIAGINTVIRDPVRTMEVNMMGAANSLFAAAQQPNVERFLNFSTSEVFGSIAFRAREDADTVSGTAGEARWTYAVSKLTSEHLAFAYHKQYGVPVVNVRPFNIYGPGQVGEGAIHVFIRRALANEPINIYGDGTQIRAWCYVDDMVEALLKTIEHPAAVGQAFNLGNSRAVTTIYGLAQTVCRILGSKSPIVFKPPLSADIELRIPDTSKARDVLGFEAKVDLEEGIQRTAEWLRSQ